MIKATFNNISVISWRSVLLVVEELAPFVAYVAVLILIIRLQVMNKEMTCFVCNWFCLPYFSNPLNISFIHLHSKD